MNVAGQSAGGQRRLNSEDRPAAELVIRRRRAAAIVCRSNVGRGRL